MNLVKNRINNACLLSFFINKIYSYEPGLYDKIKDIVFEKPFYYKIFYKEYNLGNWVEASKKKYWYQMNIFLRLLYYMDIYVPKKLEYWDNCPGLFG